MTPALSKRQTSGPETAALRCPVCGGEGRFETEVREQDAWLTSPDRFRLYACGACGSRFIDTASLPHPLAHYYPGDYYGSRQQKYRGVFQRLSDAFRRWRFHVLFDRIGTEARRNSRGSSELPSVLDFGCGRGVMLGSFRENGWEARGVEFSEQSAALVKAEYGVDVLHGPDAIEQLGGARFDLITLFHVLEHLSDPRATVRKLARHLRPGGRMVIEVPNYCRLQRGLFGRWWWHLDPPRHLVHFTQKSLAAMLEKMGFRVRILANFSVEYSFFCFLQSLMSLVTRRPNRLHVLIRSTPGADAPGPVESALTVLLAAVLAVPAAIGAIGAFFLAQGDIIRVEALLPEGREIS